jgi:MraZ protein
VFFGKYQHVIDRKNRVIVPSRLREAFAQETEGLVFYVTPGLDKCLNLFPEETFNQFTEGLGFGLMIVNKKRGLYRKFFSNVARRVCDRQGRIQIPEDLIEFAGLKDDVVFVGFKDRIELWDAENFKNLGQDDLQDFGKLAEELIGDE